MTAAVWEAWHSAGPPENFHRHAQDALRARWPELAAALDALPRDDWKNAAHARLAEIERQAEVIAAMDRELEAVRAELDLAYAEGANIGAVIGAHHARAELRAAGGQERPTDALAAIAAVIRREYDLADPEDAGDRPAPEALAAAILSAAPVGGQAEPAEDHRCAEPADHERHMTHSAANGYRWCRGGQAESSDARCRGTYMTQIHGSFRCERYAGHRGSHGAAVSGEQAQPSASAIVHRCPEGDEAVTTCCGRSPFELLADRMTVVPALVTCQGRIQ